MTPSITATTCIGHLDRTTNLVKCVFPGCTNPLCADCASFDEGRCAVHGFKNKIEGGH